MFKQIAASLEQAELTRLVARYPSIYQYWLDEELGGELDFKELLEQLQYRDKPSYRYYLTRDSRGRFKWSVRRLVFDIVGVESSNSTTPTTPTKEESEGRPRKELSQYRKK